MDGQIGPYTLEDELGRGGMGVVYRARDERLDRTVAIKALPAELAGEPARLERFEREARTLAQLNHPNLAGIHGVEEQDGARYLILEFVEGESLADRLDRGPLPVDEAVELAVQIAAGVEAAHEAGVVHRDLKPANVMITPEGRAKVLDFGLARTDEGVQSSSGSLDAPTMTRPQPQHSPTIAGAILGTAAYMSPEQARGRRVDKRTDIWSFGVVLYEMLAGASPFVGETVSDSIGAVLHKSFDPDRLPAGTPASVRRVLRRCLERDREQRYRDIGDVRLELLAGDQAGGEAAHGSSASIAAWVIAAVAAAVAIAATALLLTQDAPAPQAEPKVVRFSFEGPPANANASYPIDYLTISPDGKAIAYGNDDVDGVIYVRYLDDQDPVEISVPNGSSPECFIDGSRELVVAIPTEGFADRIVRIDPARPDPKLIGVLPDVGFLWDNSIVSLDDDTLAMGLATGGLWTIPSRGGDARELLPPEENEILVSPCPIPGTDAIVFIEVSKERVEVLEGGERSVVIEFPGDRLGNVSYLEPGFLLVRVSAGTREAGTWVVPFDKDELRATGDPVFLLPAATVVVADDGTVAYTPVNEGLAIDMSLVWVTRDGAIEPLPGDPLASGFGPVLSRDGSRVAVSAYPRQTRVSGSRDLHIIDVGTGSRFQLSDSLGSDYPIGWTADDAEIVFTTWNTGIRRMFKRPADGSGAATLVAARSAVGHVVEGGTSLLGVIDGLTSYDLETGESEVLFEEDFAWDFALSRDERYMAYVSEDEREIRVVRWPSASGLSVISGTNDIDIVRWARDDSELYYWQGDTMMAVPTDLSGSIPRFGPPAALFDGAQLGVQAGGPFDIGPDGRFLMLRSGDGVETATIETRVHVIQNWHAEIEAELIRR